MPFPRLPTGCPISGAATALYAEPSTVLGVAASGKKTVGAGALAAGIAAAGWETRSKFDSAGFATAAIAGRVDSAGLGTDNEAESRGAEVSKVDGSAAESAEELG